MSLLSSRRRYDSAGAQPSRAGRTMAPSTRALSRGRHPTDWKALPRTNRATPLPRIEPSTQAVRKWNPAHTRALLTSRRRPRSAGRAEECSTCSRSGERPRTEPQEVAGTAASHRWHPRHVPRRRSGHPLAERAPQITSPLYGHRPINRAPPRNARARETPDRVKVRTDLRAASFRPRSSARRALLRRWRPLL